jgi:hypothetical protein
MTLKKIFGRTVTLGFIALIIAGGIHWYLHIKVESALEDIIKKMYPVAVVKYEDTYSSLLNSSIGVEKVTINPRAVRDEIEIERIVFQAPNLNFLLDAKKELESGNIPEKMRISIDGFTLDSSGSIAKLLDKNMPPPSLGARDNAYGCSDIKQFGFSELEEMGYKQMIIGVTLDYQYYPSIQELEVTTLWSNREMFELKIESIFEVENKDFKLNKVRRLFDKMSTVNLTYRDLGYNQSTIRYCNLNRGDKNYVSAHIDAFKQDLKKELGLIPSSELVQAYKRFMLGSGVINISSDLQRAINPEHLALYKPRDAVLLLRPEITVNDQPVNIPYTDLLKTSGKKDTAKKVTVEKTIVLKPRNKSEFIDVDIDQLAQHVGDIVRIKTKHGITRTGTLIDFDIAKIKVEVGHRGGAVTYPITVKTITSTEVMELQKADSSN